MWELARILGVSSAAYTRHFKTKQALLDALAVTGFGRLDEAIAISQEQAGPTFTDRLDAMISSVSAAYIQARMLEQAESQPGMTVLEVGSGGLNAAYIAEIVGEKGHVVSVDIDPEVTDRAARLLDDTGYTGRVAVTAVDAAHGVPDGPFDAIIVTVGAWDIAPS